MAHASRSRPEIRFCTARDGARIAWGRIGSGPPLLKAANWMTHLELDSDGPLMSHWHRDVANGRTLISYDGRGYGLSDRSPPRLDFSAMVDDLGVVADAAELDRFALIGFCHGGPIAIDFAARHPERVAALILCGTYAAGRAQRTEAPLEAAEGELLLRIIELGWGQSSAAYRQVFTAKAVPNATPEVAEYFDELQRASANPSTAVALAKLCWHIDVRDQLTQVRCPVLVLHATRDAVVPFEQARLLAGALPDARLVPLDSDNHDLLGDEPAWPHFVHELHAFLSEHDRPAEPAPLPVLHELTPREAMVLDSIARGLDNNEIAALLQLSEKTVRNHITRIFDKLQVTSRNRAIVVARDAGLGRDSPGR
jgi:pimeloyl-ACP methyl ester carboxylesterase/DNA-binding CsgD family transcriptional regulator